MKIVRIVFGLMGAAYLIGMLAFGAGSTWLMHDPDAAAGVALGAMAVDSEAGVMDNAKGFAGGYAAGRDLSETVRENEAKDSIRQSCRSQEDSDWGAPAECDAITDADREHYERMKDAW
jgi:hypothetical protein